MSTIYFDDDAYQSYLDEKSDAEDCWELEDFKECCPVCNFFTEELVDFGACEHCGNTEREER